jgi:hypothetical protein
LKLFLSEISDVFNMTPTLRWLTDLAFGQTETTPVAAAALLRAAGPLGDGQVYSFLAGLLAADRTRHR